jgi:hypothetical protein
MASWQEVSWPKFACISCPSQPRRLCHVHSTIRIAPFHNDLGKGRENVGHYMWLQTTVIRRFLSLCFCFGWLQNNQPLNSLQNSVLWNFQTLRVFRLPPCCGRGIVFWDVTWRRLVAGYRLCSTSFFLVIKGTAWSLKMKSVGVLKRRKQATHNCVISQKSESLDSDLLGCDPVLLSKSSRLLSAIHCLSPEIEVTWVATHIISQCLKPGDLIHQQHGCKDLK